MEAFLEPYKAVLRILGTWNVWWPFPSIQSWDRLGFQVDSRCMGPETKARKSSIIYKPSFTEKPFNKYLEL